MTTERRRIGMHPRLLWDVITKQAGTVSKAILEGAMNSIDAGATHCDIEISRERFAIKDDGKGFVSLDEVQKYFETFGYPHEAGDATYGRFRMGRGQIFSFGVNRWASNEFRMNVDLKPQEGSDELGYDFKQANTKVKGCQIEVDLYDRLLPSEVDSVIQEVTAFVKWAQIPIRINGKQVNKLPKDVSWSIANDDAYISLREKGTLDVYNLGVLVCQLPSSQFGVGGTVVSKQQLEVNFARNNVQSTCPVWKRISKHIRSVAKDNIAKKPRLNDAERENIASQMRSGDLSIAEAMSLNILTDVNGTHRPLNKLLSIPNSFRNRISVAERGNRIGGKVCDRGMAFVLATETLDRFKVETVQEFLDIIKECADQYVPGSSTDLYDNYTIRRLRGILSSVEVVNADDFEADILDKYVPVKTKDLKAAERFALQVIREGAKELYRQVWTSPWRETVAKNSYYAPRTISVGESGVADGWTDGRNNIWINRNMLPLIKKGYSGMTRIAGLLLHEYLHGEPDTGTHVHDVEFYQRYHDISLGTGAVGGAAHYMMNAAIKLIRENDKALTGAFKRMADNTTLFNENPLNLGPLNDGAIADAPPPESYASTGAMDEVDAEEAPTAGRR